MDEFDEMDVRTLWLCIIEQAIDDLVAFAKISAKRKLSDREQKAWNSAFSFLFDERHQIQGAPVFDLLYFIDRRKVHAAVWHAVFTDRRVPERFATDLQRAIERVNR